MQDSDKRVNSGARVIYPCVLIDDDPWALMDIRNTMPFDEFGFELVGEYRNATDAMAAILKLKKALVISDICLGGISGLVLIENCRKRQFEGEFIIISGYSEFEYARKAIASDVLMYLLKPVDAGKCREALMKARRRLDDAPATYSAHERDFDRLPDYIRENYQQRLTLDDVAEAFHLSKTYLSERFREHFGKNFVQYKNEVRIEHAKQLLRDTQLPISEVAVQCGFDNISYFSLVFRQITGTSPLQFRNAQQ